MLLCCGEALIDMIPGQTTEGTKAFFPHCGGSVFNTAIAHGRLGQETGLLSGISSDLFGRQLIDALHASDVDTDHVVTSARPTTLAFVRLDDGQATYTFYDENTAGRMLTQSDFHLLKPSVSALFFGGISLATDPCADAYTHLAEVQSVDRTVMIDPNIRPEFISDETRFRDRLDRLIRVADIVKVSDDDLDWIQPGNDSLSAKAATLNSAGPNVVIVTRGEHGATAYLADGAEVSVKAKRVKVVDTVGAGDCFNAGVLSKLSELGALDKTSLRNLSVDVIAQALQFGAEVSAINVSRAGANPPWRNELSKA